MRHYNYAHIKPGTLRLQLASYCHGADSFLSLSQIQQAFTKEIERIVEESVVLNRAQNLRKNYDFNKATIFSGLATAVEGK